MSQESIESDILSWIAQHTSDKAIRAQCQAAKVVSRDFTGVGSYSQLETMHTDEKSSLRIADVGPLIESCELPLGGGTVLFLKDGLIDCLEIYVNGADKYPDDIKDYNLFDFES